MVISKRYLILFLANSLLFLLLLFLNEQLIEFVTLGVILNILAIYIFDNSSTYFNNVRPQGSKLKKLSVCFHKDVFTTLSCFNSERYFFFIFKSKSKFNLSLIFLIIVSFKTLLDLKGQCNHFNWG